MQGKKYIPESTNELTLHDIIKIMRRRFLIIISIFVIVVLGTFFYLKNFTTPLYEASVKIKIPTSSGGIGNLGSAAALILGTGSTGSPDVATQQEIITSRRLLEEVVKRTNLLEIKKNELKNKEGKKQELTLDNIIDSLRDEKTLSISNVKNSPVLEIKFTDKDRELTVKVLNELVNVYIETYVKLNRDEKTSQLEILEKQIPKLEQEIMEIGEKIKQFKLTKSISPSDEGQLYVSSLTEFSQQKYALESEMETTKETIAKIQSQINSLQAQVKTENYTPSSPLLEKYREKLADLQTKYNTLIQKYTEEHPEVIALKTQIKQTEEEIDKEIKRIASSKIESPSPLLQELYSQLLQNQLKLPVLKTKLDTINRSIAEVESKMKKLPQIEQEYLQLQRDYQIKQGIYAALSQKYEELKLNAVSTEVNKPQIIDPPYVPEKPSKPNKKLTLAIGGVLGLFLGIMGAFLREATDKKIRTTEDVQKLAQVPIIVYAKKDQKKAVKTILSHIFANYPEHKTITISSPDNKTAIDTTYHSICEALTEASIKFDTIETTQKESLIIVQTLENEIKEKLSKNKYIIIKAPEFKNNYDTLIASKKADGMILTIKLNSSIKFELLKTLSILEQNNIELYGIIIL